MSEPNPSARAASADNRVGDRDDARFPVRPPVDGTGGPPPFATLLRLDDRGESRVAKIAEWVGRGIIEGRLSPGDDLNSVELARRFDTSRTPVREALLLLEKEGLVEIQARRRPRVAQAGLDQIREIYLVRANLHALVAELVASTANEEQLTDLRTLLAAMESAAQDEDLDRYFWANVAFHERTAEVAANTALKRILDSLGLRVLQLRHHSMSRPQRLGESIEDHRRLLRAFQERDASLAGPLARSLVLGGLAALERAWEEGDRA